MGEQQLLVALSSSSRGSRGGVGQMAGFTGGGIALTAAVADTAPGALTLLVPATKGCHPSAGSRQPEEAGMPAIGKCTTRLGW